MCKVLRHELLVRGATSRAHRKVDDMSSTIITKHAYFRAKAPRLVMPILSTVETVVETVIRRGVHCWICWNGLQPTKHHPVEPGGLRSCRLLSWLHSLASLAGRILLSAALVQLPLPGNAGL